jgi:iron-sulfur cluster repair protein YtfE (RIC family)
MTEAVASLREALKQEGARLRRMPEEHATIEHQVEDIHQRAHFGDWQSLEEVWPRFAQTLERHLQFEEDQLFPLFERDHPEAKDYVDQLRAEHDEIRRDLEAFRMEIQLHVVRADTVTTFLDALRAHSARERAQFYPWLAEQAE